MDVGVAAVQTDVSAVLLTVFVGFEDPIADIGWRNNSYIIYI